MFQVGQARVAAQIRQYPVDAGTRAGDRAVDAFFGEQQRAGDAQRIALRQQRLAQCRAIGQLDELVDGGDD